MKLSPSFTWSIVLLLLFGLISDNARSEIDVDQAVNSSPVLARVYFSDQVTLNQLAESLDIWEVNHKVGYILVYLDGEQYQQLVSRGFQIDIDLERTAGLSDKAALLPGQTTGIPGFPCYQTVEETYNNLGNLAASYPDLAEWIEIGKSWKNLSTSGNGGYDLHTLVLTNKSIPGPKPRFFLMAAIHAREYTTAELAARFATHLIEQYDQDADITWLLDYFEIHILPIANPDGRKIAEQGIYWRKNVNNTDGCSNPNSWGTDLNRNSSFKWGLVGASPYPCDETYQGSDPASEPETQTIQAYLRGIFPDLRGPADNDAAPLDTPGIFLTLHSYGNQVFFPWAWTDDPSPNDLALQTLGQKFGYFNNYQVCQSGAPGCLYQSSGNTDDWAYGELGVPAFTFELGNAFFESCAYFENQILADQFPALIYAFKAARLPYQNPFGPDTIDLDLSAQRIAQGAGLKLTFTADDTRYSSSEYRGESGQNITRARYSIDAPPWIEGVQTFSLLPADGRADSPRETFQGMINTSGLAIGRHTIFVESQDSGGNWGVSTAVFFWITAADFQVNIVPSEQSGSSAASTDLFYNFHVTNSGTVDDSYEINLMGNIWPTSLPAASIGPLFPGENRPISIKVSIPGSAQVGDQDLAVLVVTSKGDPGRFSQVQITTTVREPMLFSPFISGD